MQTVAMLAVTAAMVAAAAPSTLTMTKKGGYASVATDPLEIVVTKPSAQVCAQASLLAVCPLYRLRRVVVGARKMYKNMNTALLLLRGISLCACKLDFVLVVSVHETLYTRLGGSCQRARSQMMFVASWLFCF